MIYLEWLYCQIVGHTWITSLTQENRMFCQHCGVYK